ncbi:class I SAM-dependent methyltransferase [Paenibacillus sp. MER 99-2]|uniref:class I SAM-dependent methyltransferase n=1 Tax=Paenibacillus sp. MER 99-2 TaxID=2939572 RepID=UPI002041773E|nr:class I SAM-dependent methyltransferase [Paenibacillus sp. MER 99-2]MCM3171659.1 class I SAM-dependent methyltransferase [Paenibacillus sp. MER 99-2]
MYITTGDTEATSLVERARKLAQSTGGTYVPRNRTSLARMLERYGVNEILVVLKGRARLFRKDAPQLEFHPSMGFVRAKRVLRGEPDPMLEAGLVCEGDTILDCTAGLGTDAMVFSVAAGKSGRVIACESSPALYALLVEGMSHYESNQPAVDEAFRRIELHHANHLELLRSLPDRSCDTIYFDPMFREPMMDSSAIQPLREYANANALAEESIVEAKRVARKRVVMKEKRGSVEFTRLGFEVLDRANAKTLYGVINVESGS